MYIGKFERIQGYRLEFALFFHFVNVFLAPNIAVFYYTLIGAHLLTVRQTRTFVVSALFTIVCRIFKIISLWSIYVTLIYVLPSREAFFSFVSKLQRLALFT